VSYREEEHVSYEEEDTCKDLYVPVAFIAKETHY
jgi:hypothetical protein